MAKSLVPDLVSPGANVPSWSLKLQLISWPPLGGLAVLERDDERAERAELVVEAAADQLAAPRGSHNVPLMQVAAAATATVVARAVVRRLRAGFTHPPRAGGTVATQWGDACATKRHIRRSRSRNRVLTRGFNVSESRRQRFGRSADAYRAVKVVITLST
jgi:hypothetical protein